ncbi:MAG: ATP-binding protein [Elusimicrobia bacterium]|nr:ATP-binding protein [Elusimicrobiota bacterium]
MSEIKRVLKIKLPRGQSAFLWGPRKTGKTTFLHYAFPDSLRFDFLDTDLFLSVAKRPAVLREMILASSSTSLSKPIILDEVQKVPLVLDEVHRLIEDHKLSFILCGSSARKLKRGHANLLGGRAWRYELHPLTSTELGDIDLLRALNQGLVPAHYLQTAEQSKRARNAYVQDYLKEEVIAEGLVRNIPSFARFFDALAFTHGEMVNYANVARDSGVDAKTAKEYFHILTDTLVGTLLEPFTRHRCRQIILKTPKFYFFDNGIANTIMGKTISSVRDPSFGRAFEHFILMELRAYRSYCGKEFSINYWRTKTGLEVDFILDNGNVAIEVKSGREVRGTDIQGLKAFVDEHSPKKAFVVTTERTARSLNPIKIVPWQSFLRDLWAGKIV